MNIMIINCHNFGYKKDNYMKKRVLVCAAFFYPHVGGYENHIYELYSRLTEFFQIDVLVTDFQKNQPYESVEGITIYRIDSWGFLGNLYPIPKLNVNNLNIMRCILKKDYTFVNTHTRFF
ncbi:hypothetical protein [Methanobacterium ferruginis]|uniref:hypothetical protein n=1 Tax=Methanobacterium ferruginis TaxID=710191 RepID=UPI00257352B8|nr:hypothetical protein [Methanobacterium ferruginis]BDZ69007.1 hypothetical protein GCM10025860_24550 [Methanobacterium ferruginis]